MILASSFMFKREILPWIEHLCIQVMPIGSGVLLCMKRLLHFVRRPFLLVSYDFSSRFGYKRIIYSLWRFQIYLPVCSGLSARVLQSQYSMKIILKFFLHVCVSVCVPRNSHLSLCLDSLSQEMERQEFGLQAFTSSNFKAINIAEDKHSIVLYKGLCRHCW